MNEKTKLCIVWLFTTIGTALIIAACVTTYWQGKFDMHIGLWKHCVDEYCSRVKINFNNDDFKLNAVRGLLVIGVIMFCLTSLMNIIASCTNKTWFLMMAVLDTLAILACISAMALYTYYLKYASYEWQWSFYIGWFGCGIYAIGVVLLLLVACK